MLNSCSIDDIVKSFVYLLERASSFANWSKFGI